MHGKERFDSFVLDGAHLGHYVLDAPLVALISLVHLDGADYLLLLG